MSVTGVIPKTDRLKNQVESLTSFIGHTPLMPIQNLITNPDVSIYAKLEWQQFGGSVKARPAFQIIKDAILDGRLTKDKTLIDASSGNTAIAYAYIASRLGIDVLLCMPENASESRKRILRSLGAQIEYTPATGSTDEAQERAAEIAQQNPDLYYYADQYNNPSNWKAHYWRTSQEIINETGDSITHFITGLGTTGTFTGTARGLKEHNNQIRTIAIQPDTPMHGLEGWKHMETAKIPGIYDQFLPDEHRTVATENAHAMLKRAAREEGLLLSPSSAANLHAAIELSNQITEGTIVTIFPDNASKYSEVINQIFE